MFSSLKYFNYRVWFASALVANVGTWMQRVAQDWLVLTVLTDNSGMAVGIVTALQFGPALLFSAWAGLLADRVSRRKMLVITQGSMGLLALGLGALVLSGHVQLWHVYVFAALLGTVAAFDNPVRQTFVGQMVPADKLANAVGLNSASFNAARLIGPAVAGVLIAAIGSGWLFVLNGVTFAATIYALTRMRTGELRPMPQAPRSKGQIREGLRYVRGRSDIIVIMAVVGVVSAFGLNFAVTSAMMARVEFGKGPGEFGLLSSVLAIGSLTGALLAARRDRPRVRLVIGSAFAFGVAAGVQALMPTYVTYAVMCIPVGLASLTMMTAANSTIQMSVDPVMRGRVMSLYMLVFLGATPVGSPLVGWLAEVAGPRWGIGIGAITAIGVSAGAAIWAKRNWNLQVRYRVLARPHLQIRYLDREAAAGESLALVSEPVVPDVAARQVAEPASGVARPVGGEPVDDSAGERAAGERADDSAGERADDSAGERADDSAGEPVDDSAGEPAAEGSAQSARECRAGAVERTVERGSVTRPAGLRRRGIVSRVGRVGPRVRRMRRLLTGGRRGNTTDRAKRGQPNRTRR